MKNILLLMGATLSLALGCAHECDWRPPRPSPQGGAGGGGSGGASSEGGADTEGGAGGEAARPSLCAKACRHLRELKCAEGEPTPAGKSCTSVCRNTEASGVVSLFPECALQITKCSELANCSD